MLNNARRPTSFQPSRARRPGACPARSALLLALAAALAGCSSDSRRLLADDGPKSASGEAKYPDVFQPKPKDAPATILSPAEQQAVKGQLRDAATTHKTAAESQITQ